MGTQTQRLSSFFYRVSNKIIHFSIGNIFVNLGDTAKPNISLDTSLCGHYLRIICSVNNNLIAICAMLRTCTLHRLCVDNLDF